MNLQPPPYSSTAAPAAVTVPVAQPTAPVVYQPVGAQGQQQSTTTVVLANGGQQTGNNNEEVIGCPTFRDTSIRCKCNNCHKTVFTKIEPELGACTWICCIVLLLCGAPCCLCFLPFCVDRFKNVRHICPCCQTTVGMFTRI